MMQDDVATFLDDFLGFYVNVSCLLNMMARDVAEKRAGTDDPSLLCEASFVGDAYGLRLVCRKTGIRPFLALVEKPWPHRAYLGRLNRDGSAHIFVEGVKSLYGRLFEEGALEPFKKDLEQVLDKHLLGEIRESNENGRALPDQRPGAPDEAELQ